jgi:Ser/Thr protein kinase RdoA (MazF antagonist)/molybdopterin-guanine dinucleotide biosynthesis protein A
MATLVLLAAGRSTRFGRPKQLEPLTASGETLIDITMREAFAYGCERVVLVVRPEHEAFFTAKYSADGRIFFTVQNEAVGTGHAVMLGLRHATGTAVIANADDHYGSAAIAQAFRKALENVDEHALIVFALGSTLSPSGPVNRAVCTVDAEGFLLRSDERTGLHMDSHGHIVDDAGSSHEPGELVSMNLWVFRSSIHVHFEAYAEHYITTGGSGECMLPDVVQAAMHTGQRVQVVRTNAQWAGLTYPADGPLLRQVLEQEAAARSLPSADVLAAIGDRFGLRMERYNLRSLGHGLINRTYRLVDRHGSDDRVLQKINTAVFREPGLIARNNRLAAKHLREHHPEQPFLHSLPTIDGADLHQDMDGGFWRLFPFIPNSVAYDGPVTPAQAFSAAQQFGRLTRCLNGADVRAFADVLPGFHDVPSRFSQFQSALTTAEEARKEAASEAITFYSAHAHIADEFTRMMHDPDVPTRITHNDTKLNNVLFDAASGKAVCVVDLDTLMPGKSLFDLGDMIRTFISAAPEDDPDPAAAVVNEDVFEQLIAGYFTEMAPIMSARERSLAYWSGTMLLYEQGLRFLTDHLNGDRYYTVHRPYHNLDRTHNQMHLLHAYSALERSLIARINRWTE